MENVNGTRTKRKTNRKAIAGYDDCEIYEDQKNFLIEQEGLTEDEAIERVNFDYDIYQFAWENFTENLTEIMHAKKFTGYYFCTGKDMGWRHLYGYKYFTADDAKELLQAVLPKTDCTITVFNGKNGAIEMRVSHHDAPTGETYIIRAVSESYYNRKA